MGGVRGLLPAAGGVRLAALPDPGVPIGAQVRVRMLRAPVNPADLLSLEGRYAFPVDACAPLGAEGVGAVEAVGPRVRDLKPGALVLPLDRGNWCTHRLVERSALIAVPPGMEPATAAMMRINPATAQLLLDASGAGRGEVLLQNAAGSAVARWVRLLAERRGVELIDIVRRPDPALPQALVDGPELPSAVAALAGDRPVRAALDCVAGGATARLAACLAAEGRVIVFGHLSGEPIAIASQALTGRQITLRGFSLRPAEAALGQEGVRRLFDGIWRLAEGGLPPLPVGPVLPMTEAAHALALARQGAGGRVQFDLSAE